MKITKELETLVIAILARMPDGQFRKVLKASLDGRRLSAEPKAKQPYKKKRGPRKKVAKKTPLEKSKE